MAEFKREDPSARYVLPDKPTVRQQMQYYSSAVFIPGSPDNLERRWNGARALILEWECEIMPDRDIDLTTVYDPKIVEVIAWAGAQTAVHLNSLEEIPKNS